MGTASTGITGLTGFVTDFIEDGKDMSCRTGPLLVGRSLRDLYTPSAGPPVGRHDHDSDHREDLCRLRGRDRYISHEVTSRRAGGPSGRTSSLPRSDNEVKGYSLGKLDAGGRAGGDLVLVGARWGDEDVELGLGAAAA